MCVLNFSLWQLVGGGERSTQVTATPGAESFPPRQKLKSPWTWSCMLSAIWSRSLAGGGHLTAQPLCFRPGHNTSGLMRRCHGESLISGPPALCLCQIGDGHGYVRWTRWRRDICFQRLALHIETVSSFSVTESTKENIKRQFWGLSTNKSCPVVLISKSPNLFMTQLNPNALSRLLSHTSA